MPQAKILLRRRNPPIADDHHPPASPWSKETRRSVFFERRKDRRCSRTRDAPRSNVEHSPTRSDKVTKPTHRPLIRNGSLLVGYGRFGRPPTRKRWRRSACPFRLHRVWDSGIIERVGTTEDFWLNDLAALDTPEARTMATKGTVEDWATESLLAARQAYRVPETSLRMKSGQTLSDAYLEANLPVVRRRHYQGSVRLAIVLNDAFSGAPQDN
jgi:hypothetical protein